MSVILKPVVERSPAGNRKARRLAAKHERTSQGASSAASLGMWLAAALAHYRAERLVAAESLCRRIIAVDPGHADGLHLLGVICHRTGRHESAIDLIGRAIALAPLTAPYHANLAAALRAMRRLDEAVAASSRAIAMQPDFAAAHYNLGNALKDQGKLAAAAAAYERALALKPDFADAHYNLGLVRRKEGKLGPAIAAYRRALALRPEHAEAYNDLGNALHDGGKLDEAATAYERALALRPDFAAACNNLGSVREKQRHLAEAVGLYRRALALAPDNGDAQSNLIFALNFDSAATPEDQQRERARWVARHAQRFVPASLSHPNRADPERRLRVGYVSAHFRHQAATYAFAPVLLHHDRDGFEVFCYSDTTVEDDLTRRLSAAADQWRPIVGRSDDAVAAMIRADGIDILVDTVGHMSGHRLFVFARKPAPVQITGWGEPTGTGLPTMDYLLADPVLVPAAVRGLLCERVIDLPCFLGYWTPEPLPEPGPLPALARGFVTFGSFNRPAKISDAVLGCWARLLAALPEARLVLKDRTFDGAAQKARFRALFAAAGIAPERVALLGAADRAGHFAAYQAIDLALDPFPHGGGMTTLDALWMGVPVLTAPGRTISSRLAAAILAPLGLADFIARDPDTYVDRAIAQARDLPALARLRGSLRQRIAASPIGDGARYARAVEEAYRAAWRRWCAAHPVDPPTDLPRPD